MVQQYSHRDQTNLQIVESVELHEVMESGEGLVGVLEVERGERWLGVIENVKICQLLLLLSFSGNTCKTNINLSTLTRQGQKSAINLKITIHKIS